MKDEVTYLIGDHLQQAIKAFFTIGNGSETSCISVNKKMHNN